MPVYTTTPSGAARDSSTNSAAGSAAKYNSARASTNRSVFLTMARSIAAAAAAESHTNAATTASLLNNEISGDGTASKAINVARQATAVAATEGSRSGAVDDTITGPICIAIADFHGDASEHQMSMREGEAVIVTIDGDSGWWFVHGLAARRAKMEQLRACGTHIDRTAAVPTTVNDADDAPDDFSTKGYVPASYLRTTNEVYPSPPAVVTSSQRTSAGTGSVSMPEPAAAATSANIGGPDLLSPTNTAIYSDGFCTARTDASSAARKHPRTNPSGSQGNAVSAGAGVVGDTIAVVETCRSNITPRGSLTVEDGDDGVAIAPMLSAVSIAAAAAAPPAPSMPATTTHVAAAERPAVSHASGPPRPPSRQPLPAPSFSFARPPRPAGWTSTAPGGAHAGRPPPPPSSSSSVPVLASSASTASGGTGASMAGHGGQAALANLLAARPAGPRPAPVAVASTVPVIADPRASLMSALSAARPARSAFAPAGPSGGAVARPARPPSGVQPAALASTATAGLDCNPTGPPRPPTANPLPSMCMVGHARPPRPPGYVAMQPPANARAPAPPGMGCMPASVAPSAAAVGGGGAGALNPRAALMAAFAARGPPATGAAPPAAATGMARPPPSPGPGPGGPPRPPGAAPAAGPGGAPRPGGPPRPMGMPPIGLLLPSAATGGGTGAPVGTNTAASPAAATAPLPAPAAAPPPQPTTSRPKKALPVPSVKLRGLFWSKIPDNEVDGTIWDTASKAAAGADSRGAVLDGATSSPSTSSSSGDGTAHSLPFTGISDEGVPLDVSQLYSLFAAAPAAAGTGGGAGGAGTAGPASSASGAASAASDGEAFPPGRRGPVLLLDATRQKNAGIALARLKIRPDDVKKALLACDLAVLTADKVALMINNLPTPDELASLKEYGEERSTLGSLEQYFLALSDVQRYEQRLRSIAFKHRFEGLVAELRHKIDRNCHALAAIESSNALKGVLRLLLAIGNALNAGNGARGGAYGIKLDVFSKLSAVKALPQPPSATASASASSSASGPGTPSESSAPDSARPIVPQAPISNLLQYIVSLVLPPGSHHAHIADLHKELLPLQPCVGDSLSVLAGEVATLDKGLQAVALLVQDLAKSAAAKAKMDAEKAEKAAAEAKLAGTGSVALADKLLATAAATAAAKAAAAPHTDTFGSQMASFVDSAKAAISSLSTSSATAQTQLKKLGTLFAEDVNDSGLFLSLFWNFAIEFQADVDRQRRFVESFTKAEVAARQKAEKAIERAKSVPAGSSTSSKGALRSGGGGTNPFHARGLLARISEKSPGHAAVASSSHAHNRRISIANPAPPGHGRRASLVINFAVNNKGGSAATGGGPKSAGADAGSATGSAGAPPSHQPQPRHLSHGRKVSAFNGSGAAHSRRMSKFGGRLESRIVHVEGDDDNGAGTSQLIAGNNGSRKDRYKHMSLDDIAGLAVAGHLDSDDDEEEEDESDSGSDGGSEVDGLPASKRHPPLPKKQSQHQLDSRVPDASVQAAIREAKIRAGEGIGIGTGFIHSPSKRASSPGLGQAGGPGNFAAAAAAKIQARRLSVEQQTLAAAALTTSHSAGIFARSTGAIRALPRIGSSRSNGSRRSAAGTVVVADSSDEDKL